MVARDAAVAAAAGCGLRGAAAAAAMRVWLLLRGAAAARPDTPAGLNRCNHAQVDKYAELLEAHDIAVPEDDDAPERAASEDDGDDESVAEPLTSLRTTALLKGQLPADTVPADDTSRIGHEVYEDEPAFGTHERQA